MLKKKPVLLFFLLFLLFLAGCGKEENIIQSNSPPSTKPLTDEVVDIHGQVENIGRLDTFVANVQSKTMDEIRLTRYTIEGDPIYYDLLFDGAELTLTIDTSEDKFGKPSVTTYKCGNLSKLETNTETKYSIENCPDGETGELLEIRHDVEKEDYFAFQLKYGENEINTKTAEWTRVLSKDEVMTTSDFHLPTETLNTIYKDMILATYLQPKTLSNSCKEKTFERYELNVWINSGTRNFLWTSCDQSEDDREMTALAKNIIEIVETKMD